MKTQPDTPRRPYWVALGLVFELGYLIVIPLLLFGLGGRWLDRRFGTTPWLFLGGMAMAVLVTTVFLVRKFSQLLRDLEKETPKKQ